MTQKELVTLADNLLDTVLFMRGGIKVMKMVAGQRRNVISFCQGMEEQWHDMWEKNVDQIRKLHSLSCDLGLRECAQDDTRDSEIEPAGSS